MCFVYSHQHKRDEVDRTEPDGDGGEQGIIGQQFIHVHMLSELLAQGNAVSWAGMMVLWIHGIIFYMQIILWIGVLVVSLIVLVKAADYFTTYSEKVGLALGMSSFIIGATIIAIGTSLPELVSSLFAVLQQGQTEFVVDNIVGSNIANALLILGIGALVAKTLKVTTSLIDVDLPFFFTSMALFVFFAWDRTITPLEGVVLLGFFVIFLIYNTRSDTTSAAEERQDEDEMADLQTQFKNGKKKKKAKKGKKKKKAKKNGMTLGKKKMIMYIAIIVLSAAAVAGSAKYLIDSVLMLSELLGISSSLLTVTVVALGTSLPEVLTSIAAIRLGNHGIAIGNVFGSNTFNLLLVGGLPALFGDLTIAPLTFVIGLPFLVIATFVAIFMTMDDKVRFWEGVAMLFLYGVFVLKITGLI